MLDTSPPLSASLATGTRLTMLLCMALLGATPVQADSGNAGTEAALPVFPGAVGFGTHTRAGRGGRVIAVTSLANDGPGTLRAALEASGPRIVVFRVGDVITLTDKLYIRSPFVTVAGQTAPGDGITLRNFGLVIVTNDVLIRHLRIRPGDEGDIDASANDAIEMLGNRDNDDVSGAYNVVLDHLSLSWAEDEVVSTWFGAHDITLSWSIVSEGLNRSRHHKGEHSSGMVIGYYSERVSVHHNLFAHNHSRNPLYKFGGLHEFTDNVVYNWGALSTDILEGGPVARINVLRNTYLPGPATTLRQEMLIETRDEEYAPKVHVAANVGPNLPAPDERPWDGMFANFSRQVAAAHYRAIEPHATPLLDAATHADAGPVLTDAGASLPRRDAIDARIIEDVKQQRGRIIDSPRQVGGYASVQPAAAEPDGDDDGMPDAWETSHGLAPADASDGNGDRDGDGYTNVEEYLNASSP